MTPVLVSTWAAPRPRGVVLLLHGASRPGPAPASRWGASAVRMLPIATATIGAGRGRVSVLRLVHGTRGWGSGASSAVADARWALEQVRRRHPGVPVALVGHSMGRGPPSTSPTTQPSQWSSVSPRGSPGPNPPACSPGSGLSCCTVSTTDDGPGGYHGPGQTRPGCGPHRHRGPVRRRGSHPPRPP